MRSHTHTHTHTQTRLQISLFFVFLDFWIFESKTWFFGPGRASKGFRDRLRFIWTKFQPKLTHLGPNQAPFSFSISRKPIFGPNSSKSHLGPGPIWAPGPMEAEGRHFGGRRPTFLGPQKRDPWSYCQLRNPDPFHLMLFVFHPRLYTGMLSVGLPQVSSAQSLAC